MRLPLLWIALGAVLAEPAPAVDYKVVVWYRKTDPIDTFKYQIYDLRRNEYTPAVDEWVEMMRTRHPNFEVVVRDVDLAREKGPNETRKVGSVVYRELLSAAAAQGVFLGGAAPLERRRYERPAPSTPSLGPMPGYGYSPLLPMYFQNPLPAGFPVPMPYPRPHP